MNVPSATTVSFDELVDFAQKYHWPGNVRELENFIERSAILGKVSYPLCEGLDANKLTETVSTSGSDDINVFKVCSGTLSDMESQLIKLVPREDSEVYEIADKCIRQHDL